MGKSVLLIVSLFAVCQSLTAQPHPSDQPRKGIDVLHYDFSLDFPDTGTRIKALAVVTGRRLEPVKRLTLDLVSLKVDSVTLNNAPAKFVRDSATIQIELPSFKSSSDTFRAEIYYQGEPADGLLIGTDKQGRWSAFGDNWPNRGRMWLASVDQPSDKATVTWTVTAPANLRVVANGELVEQTSLSQNATRTRTVWRESRPIPVYLMVVGAAPFVEYDLGESAVGLSEFHGGVHQSVFAYPEVRDFLPGPFAKAGDIVEFFARTVGNFPYEKLAHVQSATKYGGMENASAIFYSNAGFERRSMGVGVIAHETAHQWFGDAVTESAWAHVWLSEGFATYFERLWVQHALGDSVFRDGMAELRNQVLHAKETHDRPVVDTTQGNLLALLNTNSYQKGAWVLHMLRSLVGDAAFFAGIRSYYEHHRHGNALTEDLQAEMEHASGKDLGWFFEQWLRRPGYAELTIDWEYQKESHSILLKVRQSNRFAPYRFPLTLDVCTSSNQNERCTAEIPPSRNGEIKVSLKTISNPSKIVFDPNIQLLGIIRENH
ncbi:MAG: M1 family metallopeptidase [Bacteroidota bacterium]